MTDESILHIIGRTEYLFNDDLAQLENEIGKRVSNSSFLVLGGAGTIGKSVVKEIFSRSPKKLHVVDISENNLVELVREIRSSMGYIPGDFQTFALDIGSVAYDVCIQENGPYDYVFNLSALKHVRSEKDPYTLMRMIEVNILNTIKTVKQAISQGSKHYFSVSTDKAANPVNMMGASKNIMEQFLWKYSDQIKVSTARFANVAFSDGSLLCGFLNRMEKQQPIVAPNDVKRYFITPKESGQLCLIAGLFGETRDIFFPQERPSFGLTKFDAIAVRFLQQRGLQPHLCSTEEEARSRATNNPSKESWPCYFSESDTTGEKDFEEFYTSRETLDLQRFQNFGVIKNSLNNLQIAELENFLESTQSMLNRGSWTKEELVTLFEKTLIGFEHEEKGKFLDNKM
jgi:nucleoside-diphosphate-sugar epimerase